MVHRIGIPAVLAVLLTAAGAHAQLDLTPSDSFYEVEGIRVPNVSFQNGSGKVSYSPPRNWKLSGGRAKVTLFPPDIAQAGATIEALPLREAALPATAENVKAYSDLALTLLPKEASKVELVEATVSSVRISGRSMVEVTVNYSFFGQAFRTNILFMPREREMLRFQFMSRAADYPSQFRTFQSSLFSMQGL